MYRLTFVWFTGKLSLHALISRGWGHTAFVQLTDEAQQGVAVDNRKHFDLWHWPSVCRTPWPTPLSLSLPPPLSLRVRQRADAYPHGCNQTWHHMHTPILSPLIKCVSLSGRYLSPVLLSISGFQWHRKSRGDWIKSWMWLIWLIWYRGLCCKYLFTGGIIAGRTSPWIHTWDLIYKRRSEIYTWT